MLTLFFRIITAYLLAFFVFFPFNIVNAANKTTIKVVDQNQIPLPNAVVEYFTTQKNTEGDKPTQTFSNEAKPTYVMDQIRKSFVPEVLIIPKNSLVSFPNSDDLRHHVYSFSAAKTFELKLYAGKPKSPLLFPTEGVVVLGCNIHDAMVGYIYVSGHSQVNKSDQNGFITIDNPFTLIERLNVWHPNSVAGVDYRKAYHHSDLVLLDNVVTVTLNVNAPAARDTFEDQFSHAH